MKTKAKSPKYRGIYRGYEIYVDWSRIPYPKGWPVYTIFRKRGGVSGIGTYGGSLGVGDTVDDAISHCKGIVEHLIELEKNKLLGHILDIEKERGESNQNRPNS